jgi:hypothetical protein
MLVAGQVFYDAYSVNKFLRHETCSSNHCQTTMLQFFGLRQFVFELVS